MPFKKKETSPSFCYIMELFKGNKRIIKDVYGDGNGKTLYES